MFLHKACTQARGLAKQDGAGRSAQRRFMFVAYNLRRLINIIEKNVLKKFFQELDFLFFGKTDFENQNKVIRLTPLSGACHKNANTLRLGGASRSAHFNKASGL